MAPSRGKGQIETGNQHLVCVCFLPTLSHTFDQCAARRSCYWGPLRNDISNFAISPATGMPWKHGAAPETGLPWQTRARFVSECCVCWIKKTTNKQKHQTKNHRKFGKKTFLAEAKANKNIGSKCLKYVMSTKAWVASAVAASVGVLSVAYLRRQNRTTHEKKNVPTLDKPQPSIFHAPLYDCTHPASCHHCGVQPTASSEHQLFLTKSRCWHCLANSLLAAKVSVPVCTRCAGPYSVSTQLVLIQLGLPLVLVTHILDLARTPSALSSAICGKCYNWICPKHTALQQTPDLPAPLNNSGPPSISLSTECLRTCPHFSPLEMDSY